MSRENSFIFFGQMKEAPVVFLNDASNTYRVSFSLQTLRRNGRVDYPRISVYSLDEQQAREYVSNLEVGAFVICRAMVITRRVEKPIRCEKCGEISNISTMFTEAVTYGKPLVLKEQVDPKSIVEFSNHGTMLGTVCTDIRRRDSLDGPDAAQFQVAIDRRYRIDELADDPMADFPWVKTFGEIATACIQRLQRGSQVYITGSFQTRDIKRNVRCDHCKEKLVMDERVGEVIPNGVEFLNNCLFDKEEPENGEKEEAVNDEKKT